MGNQIDFQLVDRFRKEALGVTVKQMAKLLGATHVSYMRWMDGVKIRPKKEAAVRARLDPLIALLRSGEWPPAHLEAASATDRYEAINELLNSE